MSDQPVASPTTPPAVKRSSLQTPVRIVLFAMLAILIVGFAFDRKARNSASAAFDLLDGNLSPEYQGVAVKRGEVPKLIGKEPEKDDNANDEYEIYSWPGTLRSQTLYVQYFPGEDGALAEVSLNDPLPGFAK